MLMLFFRRNEYRPIKGIDTCLSYTHNRNCKYRRNEYRPIKGIDTIDTVEVSGAISSWSRNDYRPIKGIDT